LLSLACRPPPQEKPTHPLATLDGQVIVTVEDLQGALRQSPSSPARTADRESPKDLLNGLIQFQLLVREAEKAGLESDDEVQRQKKKAMVNRYMGQRLGRDPRAHTSSEEDLRAYYEQHKGDYVIQERFRVRLLELDVLPDGGASPDALIAVESKDAEAGSPDGGAVRWMTREDLVQVCGEATATAVAGFASDQTSPPIRSPRGWCVVKLLGKQAGTSKSYEQVKPLLQGRVDSSRRAVLAEQYAAELDKRSHWQANDAALATVDPMHLPEEK
jgi:hypothetical protein